MFSCKFAAYFQHTFCEEPSFALSHCDKRINLTSICLICFYRIWRSRCNCFWYTIWIFNRFLGLTIIIEGILIVTDITVDILSTVIHKFLIAMFSSFTSLRRKLTNLLWKMIILICKMLIMLCVSLWINKCTFCSSFLFKLEITNSSYFLLI